MIIIHFCPNNGGPMYEWHWAHYLGELQSVGIKIVDCNPNKILKREGAPAENAEILKDLVNDICNKFNRDDADIVFFGAQARDENLDPHVIYWIRKKGIPCVNICVDGFFEQLHLRNIGKYFDVNWVTHYSALSIKQYGCNVLYMPMAANPNFFATINKPKKDLAIAFVGSKYGARPSYIKALMDAGLKVKVRGNGWYGNYLSKRKISVKKTFNNVNSILKFFYHKWSYKLIISALMTRFLKFRTVANDYRTIDVGGEVCLERMVEFYGSNLMSLGICELRNTYVLKRPLIQYRLRDFECPMIGCAHLVRRCRELEENFSEDKNIIFYDSIEECVDKARFYLSDKNLRITEKIGSEARKLSIKEHTWLNRFNKLFNYLGIKGI